MEIAPASSEERDSVEIEIDDALNKISRSEPPRSYIGASSVGHPCDAYLELCLRGFGESNLAPRSRRIFELGNILEPVIVNLLRTAGYIVQDVDPVTGKQWRWTLYGGHVACHADGKITDPRTGVTRLLECKTMNSSKFNAFVKHGLSYSHAPYIGQATMLMGMSGIHEIMLVAYCKNDSRVAHEVVKFNEPMWQSIHSRILTVAQGNTTRLKRWKDSWPCNGCHKLKACWDDNDKTDTNCRTCKHSTPDELGGWYCKFHASRCDQPCSHWTRFSPRPR